MHSAHRFLLALGLAALSATSYSATTVYTSSTPFLAAVSSGSYTNTFDGLSNPVSSTYSGGAFGYSIAAPNGLYGSGTFLGTNQPAEALTITFTGSPVTALGANFYATNISDAFQSAAITLTLSDSTSVTFTPASVTDSYRGFTSTVAITSMTIAGPAAGSLYVGLDNFTVGVSAVPESSSLVLMGLGLVGLALAARRKST